MTCRTDAKPCTAAERFFGPRLPPNPPDHRRAFSLDCSHAVQGTTVAAYLSSLPADRRATLEAVRRVILKHKDADIAEGMQYGMIGYFVPHTLYPPGYHCDPKQPLPLAGLASQKQHCSLYVMALYTGPNREDNDLVIHLGDYIYEGNARDGQVRRHNGPEILTLDDYRARYALYKLDPALQAAHAAASLAGDMGRS